MLNELRAWPSKLKDGLQIAHDFHFEQSAKLPKSVKKIVFFGMGGSGIAGRIIKTFLKKKSDIPSFVVDSDEVPKFVNGESLAIVVSYSGNTWETVEALNDLIKRFVPTVVITHGGKAAELAEKNNIPFILLPDSLQPRFALGNFLGVILGLLDLMGILSGKKIIDVFCKTIELFLPKFEDEAYFDDFLEKVKDKEFFHVWGVSGDSAAFAYRAQTSFNENSKVRAICSIFPELAHNLLVGFTDSKEKDVVILFYSEFLPIRMNTAIDSICEILKEKGIPLYKPPVLGDTWEGQLFSMILWSDFASFYLGKRRGVDPVSVKIISDLKEKYGQKQKNVK